MIAFVIPRIPTEALTKLIERDAGDLDLYADLSQEGPEVQGLTEFFPNQKPNVKILGALSQQSNEHRLRTTLTHEYGHVKFHDCLWQADAGNAFRHIFRDQLADPRLDENLSLSLYDYSTNQSQEDQPSLTPIDLSGTTLIGAGAIGNAVIWMLKRLEGSHGNLAVVDHEVIDLGNLQRYVLTDINSVGLAKVNLVLQEMNGVGVAVRPFAEKWADYLESSDWNFPRLAVAVDTIQERINISGSLAREVVNAWTQADEVGVSRHYAYGEEACLSCLYFPDGQVPNEADLVGQAVGLPHELMLIRDLLQTGQPVDRPFLERIACALNIPAAELLTFEGKSLRHFYSQAICGGMIFRLGATAATGTEVPMAFQSALAGIFLAAEIVITANGKRRQLIPNTTRLRISSPILGNLLTPVAIVERCICQDFDFKSVYNRKYGIADAILTPSTVVGSYHHPVT
jgi:hypothetical protein